MRHTLPAVTAAVLLAVAGCSGGTATPGPAAVTTAAVPDSPPVRWIDAVCGSLLPLGPAMQAVPRVDRANAAATLQGLSGFFSVLVDAFDQATGKLKAVGPSPIRGGDEIVTRLSDALTSSRATVADARTAIDKVDVRDPAALAAELPAALAPLQQLSTLPDPTAGLRSNPELDSAAAQAPNCKAFSTAATSPAPQPGG
jgi:hypothetical protein